MFDWVVSLLEHGGYLGIFLLMLAENLFPSIPSELVMPLGGFLAARGALALPATIAVGTAGSVLGALFWYWVGPRLGQERLRRLAARHGRWLTVSPKDVDTAASWFERSGRRVVFFGRMVPATRTLISIPAGVARMPILPFLGLTALGSALWTEALASAGFLLESQYARVADWVNPVSTLVVAAIMLWYAPRLFRGWREWGPDACAFC